MSLKLPLKIYLARSFASTATDLLRLGSIPGFSGTSFAFFGVLVFTSLNAWNGFARTVFGTDIWR